MTDEAVAVLDPEAEVNGGDIEDAIKELAEDIDDLEGIDIDHLDLALPDSFNLRVFAAQRLVAVRDADILRYQMAANKLLNPDRRRDLERDRNVLLWFVALVDKKYPRAAEMSKERAKLIAAEEEERDRQKLQELTNGSRRRR